MTKTEIKMKGKNKYLKQQKHITLLKLKLKQKLKILNKSTIKMLTNTIILWSFMDFLLRDLYL